MAAIAHQCRSIKVPDTAANRGWLGKMNASLGVTGYPVIQLMTLVETGTRALIGAAFGSTAEGERDWAPAPTGPATRSPSRPRRTW